MRAAELPSCRVYNMYITRRYDLRVALVGTCVFAEGGDAVHLVAQAEAARLFARGVEAVRARVKARRKARRRQSKEER